MEENVIVLSASNWSMVDQETGEKREGTTVWYVIDDRQRINPDGSCGEVPAKVTMSFDYLNTVKAIGGLPCKAVAKFNMRTRNNKSVLEVSEFIFNGEKK